MSKRGDKEFLSDMIVACERILKYTKGMDFKSFSNDEKTLDAVVRNLEILGEAAKRISKEFKEKYSEIEWKEIAGTRDIVIHRYFGVSLEILWEIIRQDVPGLYKKLKKIAEKEGWLSETE